MLFLYDLTIQTYSFFVRIAALKNKKAGSWIRGRRKLLEEIEQAVDPAKRYIWFHFASLGEFEQGRPVLELLKKRNPAISILITFFSPSGYEHKKSYPIADLIFYLPVDNEKNAKEFVRIVNPIAAIFTKYEYWYYYFRELHERSVPLYVISAIFRKEQPFFKWYGHLHRQMLGWVERLFLQDENSAHLLSKLGLNNHEVTGDTRFDRVLQNTKTVSKIEAVESFKNEKKIFILGSSWAADEKIVSNLIHRYPGWKFIIVPHEVGKGRIQEVLQTFPGAVPYSEAVQNAAGLKEIQVLVIDNMGMLSSLYQYASIAFIGGGFGAGIHNTLEAAAFGLPVIFGPNYRKFAEAKDLLQIGAGFTIKSHEDLSKIMSKFSSDDFRLECSQKAREYVLKNTGASERIVKRIEQINL